MQHVAHIITCVKTGTEKLNAFTTVHIALYAGLTAAATATTTKMKMMVIMTMIITNVAISGDRNVIKKDTEKILKYKDLGIEIQRMWNVQSNVIPVIIGATGTIPKSFRKYLSNVPGKHEIKKYRKQSYWAQHT
jgi:hypothetical protein